MQVYETIFISPVDLAVQKQDDLVEKVKSMITKAGGEIVLVEKWGRRRLAYAIKRHREGFYVYLKFKAPSAILAELNQFYRVSDDVVRQLTCKAVRTRPGVVAPAAPAPAAEAAAPVAAEPVAKEVSHDK
ncbi:MAG TPA: 30S ribosomal protein S6 [Elusimicrobiota bacterium]|nr:30S ribosomal protein S6 [Elusimicrobiota bacterium]